MKRHSARREMSQKHQRILLDARRWSRSWSISGFGTVRINSFIVFTDRWLIISISDLWRTRYFVADLELASGMLKASKNDASNVNVVDGIYDICADPTGFWQEIGVPIDKNNPHHQFTVYNQTHLAICRVGKQTSSYVFDRCTFRAMLTTGVLPSPVENSDEITVKRQLDKLEATDFATKAKTRLNSHQWYLGDKDTNFLQFDHVIAENVYKAAGFKSLSVCHAIPFIV